MSYRLEYKNNWDAKLISAKDEYLQKSENIKSIDGARWIWSWFYCRVLLRGKFVCDKDCSGKAVFYCDNVFDLYVNGIMVAHEVKEFDGEIALCKGKNSIAIRAYQTNSENYFTSAIIGKIDYDDGVAKSFVTNEDNFKWVFQQIFHYTPEPSNWQTGDGNERTPFGCHMHPRLYKRSCCFRGVLNVKKEVSKAILNVYTEGEADIFICGKRINDEIFGKGIMDKIKEYREYDVTHLVTKGKNVICAITANTWLNSESHSLVAMKKPKIMLELCVEYADGTKENFGTDKSWKACFSPYTDNDLQFGERYDARLEKDGIFLEGFDESQLFTVDEEESVGQFVLRNYEPVKVEKRLSAISEEYKDGAYFFDFGENSMGRYMIKLKNTYEGQKIKVSFTESLLPDGTFNVRLYMPPLYITDIEEGKAKNLKNYDVYTCKGAKEESFCPHFSFSGLRYIRVDGLKSRSQLDDIKLCVMRSSLEYTGNIETSYTPAKIIHDISRHTFDSNLLNGAMDCPTREKNFWTGDTQAFAPTAFFFENGEKLFSRWSHVGRKMCAHQYGWGDEAYILPLTLYRFYGDKSVLLHCYPNMKSLFDERYNPDEILPSNPNSPFNDHLMPGKDDVADNIDPNFFAHAFYCHMLDSMKIISHIIGKQDESQFYGELFEQAKKEFIKRYYIASEHDFTPHLQTGLVLPLAFGLCPDGQEMNVAMTLSDYVLNRDKCINVGFIGCKFLLRVLCDYGQYKAAYFLINNDKYPSWRYTVSTGATTITETWYGLADAFNASMNHFSLGSVASWFYECLGGIRYDESAPGFCEVTLKPVFIKEIGDFAVTYKTPHGIIKSAWKFDGDKVKYDFEAQVPITLIIDGKTKKYEKGSHSVVI